MDAIQQSFHQMMATFHKRLDSIEVQLPSPSPQSPDSLSAEFNSFKAFVIATFRTVQQQISILAQQIDNSEMRSRRKILLLHGLPEEKDEQTNEMVAKVMSERLKIVNFSSADIVRCHRMGRLAADRSRPVLFKLRDVTLRDEIWSAKSSLKGSGITVSEFLTRTRHDLFQAARQRFGVTKCWTRDGSVFVSGPDGIKHRVSTMDDLAAIPQSSATTPSVKRSQSVVIPQSSASTTQATQATLGRLVVAKDTKNVKSRRDKAK